MVVGPARDRRMFAILLVGFPWKQPGLSPGGLVGDSLDPVPLFRLISR